MDATDIWFGPASDMLASIKQFVRKKCIYLDPSVSEIVCVSERVCVLWCVLVGGCIVNVCVISVMCKSYGEVSSV